MWNFQSRSLLAFLLAIALLLNNNIYVLAAHQEHKTAAENAVTDLMKAGSHLRKSGKNDEALATFEKAFVQDITVVPDAVLTRAFTDAGMIYISKKNLAGMMQLCDTVLTTIPFGRSSRLFALYYKASKLLFNDRDYDAGLNASEEAADESTRFMLQCDPKELQEAMSFRLTFTWLEAQTLFNLKRYRQALLKVELLDYMLDNEYKDGLFGHKYLAYRVPLLRICCETALERSAADSFSELNDKFSTYNDSYKVSVEAMKFIVQSDSALLQRVCSIALKRGRADALSNVTEVLKTIYESEKDENKKLKLMGLYCTTSSGLDVMALQRAQRSSLGNSNATTFGTIKRIVEERASGLEQQIKSILSDALNATGEKDVLNDAQRTYCMLKLFNLEYSKVDDAAGDLKQKLFSQRAETIDRCEKSILSNSETTLLPDLVEARTSLVSEAQSVFPDSKSKQPSKKIVDPHVSEMKDKLVALCNAIAEKPIDFFTAKSLVAAAEHFESNQADLAKTFITKVIAGGSESRKSNLLKWKAQIQKNSPSQALKGDELLEIELPIPEAGEGREAAIQLLLCHLGLSKVSFGEFNSQLWSVTNKLTSEDVTKDRFCKCAYAESLVMKALNATDSTSKFSFKQDLDKEWFIPGSDQETRSKFNCILSEFAINSNPDLSIELLQPYLKNYSTKLESATLASVLANLSRAWINAPADEQRDTETVAILEGHIDKTTEMLEPADRLQFMRRIYEFEKEQKDMDQATDLYWRYSVALNAGPEVAAIPLIKFLDKAPKEYLSVPDRKWTVAMLTNVLSAQTRSPLLHRYEFRLNAALARHFEQLSMWKESREYFQKAIDLIGSGPKIDSETAIETLEDAAKLYGDHHPLGEQKSLAKAKELYREAIAILAKEGKAETSAAGNLYFELARLCNSHKEYELSNQYDKQAQAIWKKTLKEDDHNLSIVARDMAFNTRALGRTAEAIDLMKEALSICKKKLENAGDKKEKFLLADLALREEELAGFLFFNKQYDDALPHYMEAFKNYDTCDNRMYANRSIANFCRSALKLRDWKRFASGLEVLNKSKMWPASRVPERRLDNFWLRETSALKFNQFIRSKYLAQANSSEYSEIEQSLIDNRFADAEVAIEALKVKNTSAISVPMFQWLEADATFRKSPTEAEKLYTALKKSAGDNSELQTAIDLNIADCQTTDRSTMFSALAKYCQILSETEGKDFLLTKIETLLHLGRACGLCHQTWYPWDSCITLAQELASELCKEEKLDTTSATVVVAQQISLIQVEMDTKWDEHRMYALTSVDDDCLRLAENVCKKQFTPAQASKNLIKIADIRKRAFDYPGAVRALETMNASARGEPDAALLVFMAQIYGEQRENQRALDLSRKALKKLRDNPDDNWPNALNIYSSAATATGDIQSAIDELRSLYKMLESKNASEEQRLPLALVLSRLLQATGNLEEATIFSRRALWYSGMTLTYEDGVINHSYDWLDNETDFKFKAIVNAMLLSLAKGDSKNAEELLELVEQAESKHQDDSLLQVLLGNVRARIELAKGNRQAAIDKALDTSKKLSRYLTLAMPRLSFAEQCCLSDLCEDQAVELLGICAGTKQLQEAYSYIFQWKGLLVETLRQHALIAAGNKKDVQLVKELMQIRRDMSQGEGEKKQDRAQLTARKEEIERQLNLNVGKEGISDPISTENIDSITHLLADGEMFMDCVTYMHATRRQAHYGMVVFGTDGKLRFVDIGSKEETDKAINALVALASGERSGLIDTRGGAIARDIADDKSKEKVDPSVALKLLSQLKTKIAPLASDRKRLWISPDGELTRIPWCLVFQDKPLSMVGSVREFVVVKHRTAMEDKRKKREKAVLLGGLTFAKLPELPGTIREVVEISKLARKHSLEKIILEKDSATKDRVAADFSGAQYIHLATHGYFETPGTKNGAVKVASRGASLVRTMQAVNGSESRNPLMSSGIVLSSESTESNPVNADNIFTAEEILSLNLQDCRLVTLSACDTGLGTIEAGQGVLGLRSAIIAAGAQGVLMSLWKVDDRATSFLMQRFYHYLWNKKLAAAEALSLAQEDTRNQPQWRAPYYWAAWVVGGKAW